MPYINVTEESSYIDVECDGYTLNFLANDDYYFFRIKDSSGTEVFRDNFIIHDGTTMYKFPYDPNIDLTVLSESAVCVVIKASGYFYDTYAGGGTALSDKGNYVFTIYPTHITLDFSWALTSEVTLGTASYGPTAFVRVSATHDYNIYTVSG